MSDAKIRDPRGIRPLRPWGKRKLRDHLLRLDPDGRRARFGGEVKDRTIERFVANLDRQSCVGTGYFERGTLRGSALLVRHPVQWFEGAELSLAVERGWRGFGIGQALAERAMADARRRGIRALYVSSMRDNDVVITLARRLGATVHTEGAVEGTISLPPWRRAARRSLRMRLALVRRRLVRRLVTPKAATG